MPEPFACILAFAVYPCVHGINLRVHGMHALYVLASLQAVHSLAAAIYSLCWQWQQPEPS
jgi:hypothetical protein